MVDEIKLGYYLDTSDQEKVYLIFISDKRIYYMHESTFSKFMNYRNKNVVSNWILLGELVKI